MLVRVDQITHADVGLEIGRQTDVVEMNHAVRDSGVIAELKAAATVRGKAATAVV